MWEGTYLLLHGSRPMAIRIAKTALSARLGEVLLDSGHGADAILITDPRTDVVPTSETQAASVCCGPTYLFLRSALGTSALVSAGPSPKDP
jgi:hypothetical protein